MHAQRAPRVARDHPRLRQAGAHPPLRTRPRHFPALPRSSSRAPPALTCACALPLSQLDDECYNNTYWASVGGVALPHLNQLEIEVMSLLQFNLLVNASSLDAARQRLLASA